MNASPERVEQVWALLRSYADWEPGLTTWTGSVVRSSGSMGEAAGVRNPCEHCDGTGKAGRANCRFCKGAGVVWSDPQTGRQVQAPGPVDEFRFDAREAELAVRHRRVRCDTCGGSGQRTASSSLRPEGDHDRCPPCAGTGRVDAIDERLTDASLRRTERDWGDQANADPGWWLPAALERKQAQWVRGSYPELEQLLARLQAQRPHARRILDRFVIHDDGTILGARADAMVDALVIWLAVRMPNQIRVPDEAKRVSHAARESLWRGRTNGHTEQRELRDGYVRDLHADGVGVPELQVRMALSRSQVYAILQAGQQAVVASGPAA